MSKDSHKDKADKSADKKKKSDQIKDSDLDKASGGAGGVHSLDHDAFMKITGPTWVKLMAYRKAGWAAEPEKTGSLVDLHKKLETEAADED
jgi:hypothetical protein